MVTFLVLVALAVASGSARADEVPLVTGERWAKSTEQLKEAYLDGIGNVIQVETAYHGASAPSDGQSFVPRFAMGLEGQTLDSARGALDRCYGANPDRSQRPIIETIWFELVVPGLQKTK
jgi:hypothetical protein